MSQEPKTMREIHEIRERLYEEEKNLTVKERISKIKKEAKAAIEKYGLKLRKHHSVNT